MANSTLKHREQFISGEAVTMASSAESVSGGGGTVPVHCGNIWFYVPIGDNIHWHPTGTPTSSFGHAVTEGNWGRIPHHQQGAKLISDDDSDVSLIVLYERGPERPDNGRTYAAGTAAI
jgi:hypothetical protein